MRHILVAPRHRVFPELSPNRFVSDTDPAFQLCLKNMAGSCFYMERGFAEQHHEYVQIIPTIVMCTPAVEDPSPAPAGEVVAVRYQRAQKHTEQRLAGKMCILFGGHVDVEDSDGCRNDFMAIVNRCARREMQEETGLCRRDGSFYMMHPNNSNLRGRLLADSDVDVALSMCGLIKVETNPVDQVHVGLVYVALIRDLKACKFDPKEVTSPTPFWPGSPDLKDPSALQLYDGWSQTLLGSADFHSVLKRLTT